MRNLHISFIGGGNMAEALVSSLIRNGHPPEHLTICDIKQNRLIHLQDSYGIMIESDSHRAALDADILVLAVKPQSMQEAVKNLGKGLSSSATVISIAAGLGTGRLLAWLGQGVNLVRVMPNTPCLVGSGMSVLFADPAVAEDHRHRAEYVLNASGEIAWVEDESMLHAVTAVSGSCPAYYFLMSEVIEATGVSLGLPEELARKLAQQTAFGAGKMLAQSGRDATELRQQVASPGGTTQEALDVMYDRGLPAIIRAAVKSSEKRSRELA